MGLPIPVEQIQQSILLIRGKKVMLDTDLAQLYGVSTKRLNEQVKRNRDRFPVDFMFQLNPAEVNNLRSHFATSVKVLCHAKAPRPPKGINSEKGPSQIFVVLWSRQYLRSLRLCVRQL